MDSIIVTVCIENQPQYSCDIEIPVEEMAEKASLDILECLNCLWPELNINLISNHLVRKSTKETLSGSELVSEKEVLNGEIFYLV